MVARRILPDVPLEDLRAAATLLSGGDEPELSAETRDGYVPTYYARCARTGHSARSTKNQHAALAKLIGVLAAGQVYRNGAER